MTMARTPIIWKKGCSSGTNDTGGSLSKEKPAKIAARNKKTSEFIFVSLLWDSICELSTISIGKMTKNLKIRHVPMNMAKNNMY